MDDRPAGLSPRQLQCLRLVARGWEAKEIGRELGISDLTVKNHLSAARAALGVARSIDAARLVAALEAGEGAGASGTSTLTGIPDRSYLEVEAPGQSGMSADTGLGDAGGLSLHREARVPLPFPTRRGQRNDLGIAARLGLMMLLTVLLIAAVGFFVEASRGLKF
jgi:DNA-binding CsgD family transcriptional regulator